MRLALTEAAGADLAEIARSTEAGWGVAQKRRYLGLFFAAFVRLRTNPELGPARDDLKVGYRAIVVGRHLVVYRIESAEILVLRVLHGSMDVRARRDVDPDAPASGTPQ